MAKTHHSTSPATSEDCRSIPELVLSLSSHNGVERQSAREQLVLLGDPAIPELIKCLSDPRRQVRWEAAKALGDVADPIAATALAATLDDEDGDVRWLAAIALAALGREGLPPLLAALIEHSDSDWLREGAHHVCHDLAKTADKWIVKPVLDALNAEEPELAVPSAAYSALGAFQPGFTKSQNKTRHRV
jgi:HEAT repeat protein